MSPTETTCRCGHEAHAVGSTATPHPCHGKGYTCPNQPTKPRFVSTGPAALAGMQMKVGAYQTFACDECWDSWTKEPHGR